MSKPPKDEFEEYQRRMALKLRKMEAFGTGLKAFKENVQYAIGPRPLRRIVERANELRPQSQQSQNPSQAIVPERFPQGPFGFRERFMRWRQQPQPQQEDELTKLEREKRLRELKKEEEERRKKEEEEAKRKEEAAELEAIRNDPNFSIYTG